MTENEGDHKIPSIRMDQSMCIAVAMVQGLIATFFKPTDDEETKTNISYMCLSVFLLQLCGPAKHKDKMIGLLKIIIDDLEEKKNEN
jgi:hypothetical protein